MSKPLSPSAILGPVPAAGRFLTLGLRPSADPTAVLAKLRSLPIADGITVGFGDPLVRLLGGEIAGLKPFVATSGPGVSVPSTQGSLWLSFGGDGAGDLLLLARRFMHALESDFIIDEEVSTFFHQGGRDLTGYEDGTENPKGERAAAVAIARGEPGIESGSFVAAQRWVHALGHFESLSDQQRDYVFGRKFEGNEEIADAPASAHVKRSAQESFDPEAFMVRRSMPWGDSYNHGLYFVAYGATLSAFERVLHRMVGLEDGITDALFSFTRPVSGGYYFCPPILDGRLDLRAVAAQAV